MRGKQINHRTREIPGGSQPLGFGPGVVDSGAASSPGSWAKSSAVPGNDRTTLDPPANGSRQEPQDEQECEERRQNSRLSQDRAEEVTKTSAAPARPARPVKKRSIALPIDRSLSSSHFFHDGGHIGRSGPRRDRTTGNRHAQALAGRATHRLPRVRAGEVVAGARRIVVPRRAQTTPGTEASSS